MRRDRRQRSRPYPQNASVDELLATADKLLAEIKGNTAFPIYERALERATEMSLEAQQARARFGMARVLYYRAQYAAAREHALTAVEIYERVGSPTDIGRVYNFLSAAEELSGLWTEARDHSKRAVTAYESSDNLAGRARAMTQLVRVTPMDIDARRRTLGRAAADARAAGDIALEASILHGLGDQLFTANHFDEALDTLLQAESLLLGTSDLGELGTTYTSIGRVYRAHGRFDEALRFQLKALSLHEKGGSAFELMQSLNAVATVYERLNDSKNAANYYERALVIAEKSSSQRIQDFIRANFSSLLIDRGEYARAASELEQVLAHGLDAFPSRRQKMLSLAYSKMDRRRDALAAATKAVDLCKSDEASCIEAFGRRAATHAALGDAASALADLNAALDFIEDLAQPARADRPLQAGFQPRAAVHLQSGHRAAGAGETGAAGARDRRARQVARVPRLARQPRCPGERARPPADRGAAERGLQHSAAVRSEASDGQRPCAGADASW